MTSLLLIEDDEDTAEEVVGFFRTRGYATARAADGIEGLARARQEDFDVLIVDRMLPLLDGLSVLMRLRHHGVRTPAIVLSALGGVDERIDGLRAGGDDYLIKPFSLAELAARVDALLRRPSIGPETVLRVGPLHLDLVQRIARRNTREIDLLPREFRLLEYMMRRAGQTVTRSMLFEDVWNYRFTPRSNVIDVHMDRLRRKLSGPGEEDVLLNVRGIGFLLNSSP